MARCLLAHRSSEHVGCAGEASPGRPGTAELLPAVGLVHVGSGAAATVRLAWIGGGGGVGCPRAGSGRAGLAEFRDAVLISLCGQEDGSARENGYVLACRRYACPLVLRILRSAGPIMSAGVN